MEDAATEFAFRLADIAATTTGDRLAEAVRALRDLFDAPAVAVTRSRGVGRPAGLVLADGYSPILLSAVVAADFPDRDPAQRRIREDPLRPVRCWWDHDIDYQNSDLAREFLVPAGFRGGVSLRLHGPRGVHVGDLHMSTDDRRIPGPEVVRILLRSRAVLAHLCQVDLLPVAPGRAPDEEVVLIGCNGRPEQLVTSQAPSVAAAFVTAAQACAAIADGVSTDRVRRWLGPDGAWRRLTIRPSSTGTIVAARRENLPHGLTARELDILTLLGDGTANFGIARRLGLSERTVAHHLERIFAKVGAVSRAHAAAIAERDGLVAVG